jgi:hypothetical protein
MPAVLPSVDALIIKFIDDEAVAGDERSTNVSVGGSSVFRYCTQLGSERSSNI